MIYVPKGPFHEATLYLCDNLRQPGTSANNVRLDNWNIKYIQGYWSNQKKKSLGSPLEGAASTL